MKGPASKSLRDRRRRGDLPLVDLGVATGSRTVYSVFTPTCLPAFLRPWGQSRRREGEDGEVGEEQ